MKYEKVAIFLTLLCLWGTQFLLDRQVELALVFVLSVGIWHGSNDIDLIREISRKKRIGSSLFALVVYVLTVAIGTVLFVFLPGFALLIFVVFSAYHFGEQHWMDKYDDYSNTRFALAVTNYFIPLFYGLLILEMIFYFNQSETNDVLKFLIGTGFSSEFYLSLLIITVVLFLFTLIILLVKHRLRPIRLIYEVFLLVLLGIIFNYTSLVWGFAIYFVIWHSLPSIQDQLRFLYGRVSLGNLWLYIKKSWWVWSISIGALMLVWKFFGNDEAIKIPLLFGMLGSVTFSHSFVIALMKKGGISK